MNSPLTNKTPENSQIITQTSIENLWTILQVDRYLGISPKSVYNRRKKGLPFSQLGGAVRFDPQKVRDYVNNDCSGTSQRQSRRRKGGT